MKIQNLLENNIDFDMDTDSGAARLALQKPEISFADLNTLQVRTLNRIANGEVTVDDASENEFDIMQDLHDLGFLDDDYALSDLGLDAVETAKEIGGSSEIIDARMRDRARGNDKGFSAKVVDDDFDDEGDDFVPVADPSGEREEPIDPADFQRYGR